MYVFFNGDCANYDEDANHDNDDTNVNGRNSKFMILMIKLNYTDHFNNIKIINSWVKIWKVT